VGEYEGIASNLPGPDDLKNLIKTKLILLHFQTDRLGNILCLTTIGSYR
jgi:hypothetical protein